MNLESLGFYEINHDKLTKTNTPYKIYAQLLDETTQKQFRDVLDKSYVTYAALMPDAHAGYTMPIGGVCSTKDVIVPQFVGFDIGCGMCAYRSDFTKDEVQNFAKEIYAKVVEQIPLGFKKHKNHQSFKYKLPLTDFAEHILLSSGLQQLGTLGGGNHFIEIGYDSLDRVWIIIHSGSRGFGHKIASHYMLQAYLSKNPKEEKLEKFLIDFENRNKDFKNYNPTAYEKALLKYKHKQMLEINKRVNLDNIEGIWELDVNSKLGKDYIKDQNFALFYALQNRKKMIETVHKIMNKVLNKDFEFIDKDNERFINKNHNHVEYDKNRGEWIHRKGATHADLGVYGVIPGNMRDGSFIVKGKGCVDSLCSSSHGAGRVMSRKKAKNSLSLKEFESSMSGIVGTVDKNTLDESAFAYKDIFEVMKLQSDLVDVIEHIKVIINVKDNTKSRF